MPDSWPQLVLETNPQNLPVIEQALFDSGALSVTLRDREDEPVLEPAPGEVRLWQSLLVTALFDGSNDPDRILASLAASLGNALPECRFEQLPDADWERSWMARFKAMRFGDLEGGRLWVCPSHVEPPEPRAINLRLDPGLAFGSGTHPTTGLCLSWLANFDPGFESDSGPNNGRSGGAASKESSDARLPAPAPGQSLGGKSVIDYGCGSGILAVAAGLLGASRIVALDIDPQALIATRDNAVRNGVESRVETGLPGAVELKQADILLANILFAPLMELAGDFSKLLKPGGVLVLSGLLEEQVDELMLHYTQWFSFEQTRLLNGWALLAARCREDDQRNDDQIR